MSTGSGYWPWFRCKVCSGLYNLRSKVWSHLWTEHQLKQGPGDEQQWEEVTGIRKPSDVKIRVQRLTEDQIRYLLQPCEFMGDAVNDKGTDEEEDNNFDDRPMPKLDGPFAFKCQNCPKLFDKKKNLYNHCSRTRHRFPYAVPLQKKIMKPAPASGLQNLSCPVCRVKFPNRKDLLNHRWIKKHDPLFEEQSTYTCDYPKCRKDFRTPKTLEVHKCRHDPSWKDMNIYERNQFEVDRLLALGCKLHKCPLCPAHVVYRWRLAKHLESHSTLKPFKCDICGVSYKTQDLLRRHKEGKKCELMVAMKAERTFKCEICGAFLKSEKGVQNHQRTVHGVLAPRKEKPDSTCLECGYDAKGPKALEKHMRTHTGEKPYTCVACNRKFSSNPNMLQHMRNYCPDAKRKGMIPAPKPMNIPKVDPLAQIMCRICGIAYEQSSTLISHKKTHGDSFFCDTCPAGFINLGALSHHQRVMHGKESWGLPCNVCGKNICNEKNLTRHYMGFHAIYPPKLEDWIEMTQGQLRKERLAYWAERNAKEEEEREQERREMMDDTIIVKMETMEDQEEEAASISLSGLFSELNESDNVTDTLPLPENIQSITAVETLPRTSETIGTRIEEVSNASTLRKTNNSLADQRSNNCQLIRSISSRQEEGLVVLSNATNNVSLTSIIDDVTEFLEEDDDILIVME